MLVNRWGVSGELRFPHLLLTKLLIITSISAIASPYPAQIWDFFFGDFYFLSAAGKNAWLVYLVPFITAAERRVFISVKLLMTGKEMTRK